LGRRPMDDPGGQRGRRSGPRARRLPLRALLLARPRRVPEQGAIRDAFRLRWARGEEVSGAERPKSDALVFFGATGDLAYKKIFPALQSMVRRGRLDVPVVGVAKSGWNNDQLIERARASVTEYGGLDADAFPKLAKLIRYVDGDYGDPATFGK